MRMLIVYGSTYGDTADAADRIATRVETLSGVEPVLREVGRTDLSDLESYDVILVGCSTWNEGEIQDDWFDKLPELDSLDLGGKRVALFGSGDQLGYPITFQDALGIIAEKLEARGAQLVGLWPTDGYEFDASLALRGDEFVGLALDYTCQIELNEDRIERWTAQLVEELGLVPALPAAL
ncbi:MAG TPA: flavodoxin [Trueperaceae bacterium]